MANMLSSLPGKTPSAIVRSGDGIKPIHKVQSGEKRFDIARDAAWLNPRSYDMMSELRRRRGDAVPNPLFQEQVTAFLPELVRVPTREANARQIVPYFFIPNGRGALSYEYKQIESHGEAKFVSDKDTKPPVVELTGKAFRHDFHTIWMSAEWHFEEMFAHEYALRNGSMMGSLNTEKLASARVAVLNLETEIAWFGNKNKGLFGYLSEGTAIPKENAPFAFDGATADQMLDLLNTGVTRIVETTDVERPTSIGLGTRDYLTVFQTPTGDNKDKTVAQAFLENNPFIQEIIWIRQLGYNAEIEQEMLNKGKSPAEAQQLAGGIGGEDVMLTWDRSPDVSRMVVNADLQLLPPEVTNYMTSVAVISSNAGVEFKRPRAHHLLVGV